MDSFVQLAPPDLSGLGLGTASFESMQALGFSADSSLLLVKISFTDDGEATPFSKYATFVYDLTEEKYIANLNELLGPEANVTQVKDAYIIGDRDSWEVVANVDVLNADSTILKSYSSTGEVVNNLVVAEATGLAHLTSSSEIEVESFQLTDDGRYLAVQTSSDLLAVNASDDVNQSSDIYLIDRDTGVVTRVSFQGGIGKDDAVYLADIAKQGSQLQVAFVTDQYFSTEDLNSISVDLTSSAESRNDLYLASSDLNQSGNVLGFDFELLSKDTDGYATGFVDRDSDSLPKITEKGVYFSSDSFSLVSGDNNEAKDVFLASNTVSLIKLRGFDDLSSGADFVGASEDGNFVYLKTSSQEIDGLPGVAQILKVDTSLQGAFEVISNNGQVADNTTINGAVSSDGAYVAFTSLATNLVTNDATLESDYDLYVFGSPEVIVETAVYYYVLNEKDVFMDFSFISDKKHFLNHGQVYNGNNGVDAVYVGGGFDMEFDFSNMQSGVDKIYLEGTFSDYAFATTGFKTFWIQRTGETNEKIFLTKGEDLLVFSNGSVTTNEFFTYARDYAADSSSAEIPSLLSETSSTFPINLPSDMTLDNQVYAYVTEELDVSIGAARPGVETVVSGNNGVDTIYVTEGAQVDARNTQGGADLMYLTGNFDDYTAVKEGLKTVQLSRTVTIDGDDYLESLFINRGDDIVVFANGSATASEIYANLDNWSFSVLNQDLSNPFALLF